MTNAEFHTWLENEFKNYMVMRHELPFSLNELVYVLKNDQLHDYNLSWSNDPSDSSWSSVPSVKECFIPSRDLIRKVTSISYEEEEFDGETYFCLELKLAPAYVLNREQIDAAIDALDYAADEKAYGADFEDEETAKEMRECAATWERISGQLYRLVYPIKK